VAVTTSPLASRTGLAWARRVLARPGEVLLDHAHCEKKAASTALSLLFKYPERGPLLAPLSRLAREELLHFEQVLGHLTARGTTLRHQVPSPYAGELRRIVRPDEPARLLDTLLCMALIEARSCERLGLLADALDDPELAAFYRTLVASEARHHETYVELATRVAPEEEVAARLREVASHEAAVLAASPPMARLHA
jgi:tRNA-(ms[2]io[6]A)-hydroxylase